MPLLLLLPHLTGYFLGATAKSPVVTSARYKPVLERIGSLPGDGRILIDEIPLGHLTPAYAGRPIIGGLSTQAFLKHGFAGIDDRGVLFGTPAEMWTGEALAEYLRLYAVQYLVLSREVLVDLATRSEGLFKPLWSIGSFTAFEFTGYDGYAFGSNINVKAEYNRIMVDAPAGASAVLKFHWSAFLHCGTPGVSIEPAIVESLPVPFVRISFPEGLGHAVITHSSRHIGKPVGNN